MIYVTHDQVEAMTLAHRIVVLHGGRIEQVGTPLELSRVHWVKPELVVEVTYLTWTEDGLLRQVSYQGERQDKPARQVKRAAPHT